VSEPDSATIWHRFRTEARRAVSETTWHIWLERLGFRELAGTTLVLEAPDDVRSWVETRFTRLLTTLVPVTRTRPPIKAAAKRSAKRAAKRSPRRSSRRGTSRKTR